MKQLVKILLFGDQADHTLADALYHYHTSRGQKVCALSMAGNTGDHRAQTDMMREKAWDYLIVESEHADIVSHMRPDIFVFKENHTAFKKPCFSAAFPRFIVFSAADELASPLFYACPAGLIPCGLSEKDTLTFSSIETASGCISLQRGLENLHGEIVEPCEMKFTCSIPFSYYHALSFSALLFLMEKRDSLPAYVEISAFS